MKRAAALAVVALTLLAACGGDDNRSPTTTNQKPTTTAAPVAATEVKLSDVHIKLTEVAQLDQPLGLAVRPKHTGLFIAEKGGRVKHVPDSGGAPTTVLDISKQVSNGNEQGLLGLTFSPDGSKLYVYYTNTDGDSRLNEYRMDDGPEHADPSTRREVFATDQPFANHNGGELTFGPDGLLYLGLGDGGSEGDPHGNGQNPDALLGKILRFDPANAANPERYAIGLRNPWRFSFDRETDDLWIGDVGQDTWEEIDHVKAGTPSRVNLGWNLLEATHPFHVSHDPGGTLLPVYEYNHDVGQSVVGGYVYRGKKIPSLQGIYLFADTYKGNIQALRLNKAEIAEHADLGVAAPQGLLVSFGEDADGELYVISLNGGVYRIDAA